MTTRIHRELTHPLNRGRFRFLYHWITDILKLPLYKLNLKTGTHNRLTRTCSMIRGLKSREFMFCSEHCRWKSQWRSPYNWLIYFHTKSFCKIMSYLCTLCTKVKRGYQSRHPILQNYNTFHFTFVLSKRKKVIYYFFGFEMLKFTERVPVYLSFTPSSLNLNFSQEKWTNHKGSLSGKNERLQV